MATRSSVLAWRIPGTGAPGGLPSVGSHGVGHDWRDAAAAAAAAIIAGSNLCSSLEQGEQVILVLALQALHQETPSVLGNLGWLVTLPRSVAFSIHPASDPLRKQLASSEDWPWCMHKHPWWGQLSWYVVKYFAQCLGYSVFNNCYYLRESREDTQF